MRVALSFCLLLLATAAQAQLHDFVLRGSLGVQGGESFTYKLEFLDSAGYINGFSYTYDDQKKDTKAVITGGIDRVNKTLVFRETKILYNNGFYSNATICLVEAALYYKKVDGQYALTGSIISSDVGNASCARGTLYFPDSKELRDIFNGIASPTLAPATAAAPVAAPVATAPKPAKPSSIRVVYDTAAAPRPAKPVAAPAQITAGTDKVYEWNSDLVVLDLWDGGQIDNDNVTVLFNGQAVLSRHTLTRDKKQLQLPLSGKETDVITITANNEGNEPPNTANILLSDGSIQYPVVAYNTIGKQAIIRIRKKAGH